MFLVAVSLFVGVIYAGLLGWYSWGWYKAGKPLPANNNLNGKPVFVSVIIPARNESANIEKCLYSLLAQQYPKDQYEIIVVDDDSEDNTADLVGRMAENHACIRLIAMRGAPGNAHKKRAVEKGIEAAAGPLIACTDADCVLPAGWLLQFVEAYGGGQKKFIAGPVLYATKPGLLSVFQTLDFMTLQGITAASVATGFHTMCNGANIAYDKAAFYEVNGFDGIDDLPTGDDMLLMYKIFRRYPAGIAYLRVPGAIVHTEPVSNWTGFFQQRIRWASKAAYYDDKRIFAVLLLVYLFNAWLAFLFFYGWVQVLAWKWLAILLVIKILCELFFLWPVASFFEKTRWLWWFPFFQPMHIVYTLVAGWLGKFGSYQWKGRIIAKPSVLKK